MGTARYTPPPLSGLIVQGDGFTPASIGAYGWTQRPDTASTSTQLLISGRVAFFRIPGWLAAAAAVKNYWLFVSNAGATLTAGQSLAALYTGAGVLIPNTTSPDQSTAFTSLGVKQLTLAAAQAVAADPLGFIHLGIMSNGGTPPQFRGGNSLLVNAGITGAAPLVAGIDAQIALTAMPATINPAANSATVGQQICAVVTP